MNEKKLIQKNLDRLNREKYVNLLKSAAENIEVRI